MESAGGIKILCTKNHLLDEAFPQLPRYATTLTWA
jgi:hypothetical protein